MAGRFVAAFGVMVMGVGAWVLVEPLGLKSFADLFLTTGGLWVAVGLRLLVGVLLWISASASRAPRILQVLGALFVFSAFALPILGLERMQRLADWGVGLDEVALRAVGLVALGFGAFIVWSVRPRRSER